MKVRVLLLLSRVFRIFNAVNGEKKIEVEGDVVKRGKSVAFCESVVRRGGGFGEGECDEDGDSWVDERGGG